MSVNYFDSTYVAGTNSSSDSNSSGDDSSSEEEKNTKQEIPTTTGRQERETAESKPMLSAMDAFKEVDGPPEFLDPEAIRPSLAMHERKRKVPQEDATEEAVEKKQRQTVIAAKAITYETPRDPEVVLLSKETRPKDAAHTSSKSMGVDDFLTKGGGALLPRKTRLQRDKEKAKREKGQSSHSTWKSEDEMLLRQQFDS